jgi:hypothetical protein
MSPEVVERPQRFPSEEGVRMEKPVSLPRPTGEK